MAYSSSEKKRVIFFVPVQLYDRLKSDSNRYGISMTAIIHSVLVDYYRGLDLRSIDLKK